MWAGILLSLCAAATDWLAWSFTAGEQHRAGEVHVSLLAAGITFTVSAVYAWMLWIKKRPEMNRPSPNE